MLNLVCCGSCDTPESLAYLDRRLRVTPEPLYSDVMVDTARPERHRHLAKVLELERDLGTSRSPSAS